MKHDWQILGLIALGGLAMLGQFAAFVYMDTHPVHPKPIECPCSRTESRQQSEWVRIDGQRFILPVIRKVCI